MSNLLQGLVVGVLVLGATAYAVWRLGPASLRRRWGRGGRESGCADCHSAGPRDRK